MQRRNREAQARVQGQPVVSSFSSRLYTSSHNALHEVALANEENQNRGKRHDQSASHDRAGVGAVSGAEQLQAQRHGVLVHVVEVEHGAEEVVPRTHEGKEHNRDAHRADERQQDLPVDAERAAAIQRGRLIQRAGQGHEELTEQEDVERAAAHEAGEDQRPVGVDGAQLLPDEEAGNQRYGAGNEHGADADGKPAPAEGKLKAGKAVGGYGGAGHRADNDRDHDDDGVEEVLQKRYVRHENVDEVLPRGLAGPPQRRHDVDLNHVHEGRADQPEERYDRERRAHKQQPVYKHGGSVQFFAVLLERNSRTHSPSPPSKNTRLETHTGKEIRK